MGDLTRARLGSCGCSPFSLDASMAGCAEGGALANAGAADAAAYEGAATTISCGAANEARRMRTRLSPRCTSSSATPVSVAKAISSRISSTVINGLAYQTRGRGCFAGRAALRGCDIRRRNRLRHQKQGACSHWWGRLQPVNARLRAQFFSLTVGLRWGPLAQPQGGREAHLIAIDRRFVRPEPRLVR